VGGANELIDRKGKPARRGSMGRGDGGGRKHLPEAGGDGLNFTQYEEDMNGET